MIKVIKDRTHKRFKQECPMCECVFYYEKEDIQEACLLISHNGVKTDSYTVKKYIDCPQCTERIILAERKEI